MRHFAFKWLIFLVPIFPLFGSGFEDEIEICKRGEGCFVLDQNEDTDFFAFISLSMPEQVLLEMSKGLVENGGAFVLQGLPNNSFEELILVIFEFRKKGIEAPVTVDPYAFEKYQVTSVPTFVLEQARGYRKVVGNVTVDYALKTLREEDF